MKSRMREFSHISKTLKGNRLISRVLRFQELNGVFSEISSCFHWWRTLLTHFQLAAVQFTLLSSSNERFKFLVVLKSYDILNLSFYIFFCSKDYLHSELPNMVSRIASALTETIYENQGWYFGFRWLLIVCLFCQIRLLLYNCIAFMSMMHMDKSRMALNLVQLG